MKPIKLWSKGVRSVRSRLALLSPRRRRWQRFLSSLTLDPHQLPRPLTEPSGRDFIICGAPRTGTTLLSAMLFQPPHVVTVMEPWNGMQLPPAELFQTLRAEILETGRLNYGKLDISALMQNGAVKWQTEGKSETPLPISDSFFLGVKWPAYWQYLELLPATKFLICIRHPQQVVASYKKQGGRIGEGLEYDVAFNRKLNAALKDATDNVHLRRILLYEYINSRLLPYLNRSNVLVVRYERWFSDTDAVMKEIGAFLGVTLDTKPATIRPPQALVSLTEHELSLMRKHCASGYQLGYYY